MNTPSKLFIAEDGDGEVSPESIFHGRIAWIDGYVTRVRVMFHEWKGWISPMEFFGLELLRMERFLHRSGN